MTTGVDTLPIDAQRREARLSRVKMLRRALPALAIGLIVVCAVQVALSTRSGPSTAPVAEGAAKMLLPRFSGRTSDGRSFVITGKDGVREDGEAGRIRISEPVLTLRRDNARTQRMTAASGLYDETGHTLLLTGDVRMDNGSGTRFASNEARIDTRKGTVSGQKGLRVEGAAGAVQSGTYTADDQGDRVILKGGVRGRLTPQN